MLVVVAVLCIYVFVISDTPEEYIPQTAPPAAPSAEPVYLVTQEENPPEESEEIFARAVYLSEIFDTQYLKLVNRDLAITTPMCHSLLVTVWPYMPAGTTDIRLHKTAFAAMLELFEAARDANIGGLFIASGYRSHEHQTQIYQNAADRRYVMTPGHSEHQLGLAADILSANNNFQTMRGTPEAE